MPILNYSFQAKIRDAKGRERPVAPSDGLQLKGPVVHVTLSSLPQHRPALGEKGQDSAPLVGGLALLDTGAGATCVDRATAEQACMAVVGDAYMSSATHSNHPVPLFAGVIDIPGFGAITMLKGFGATLANQGVIALIGRDILKNTLFVYNGITGAISLSR